MASRELFSTSDDELVYDTEVITFPKCPRGSELPKVDNAIYCDAKVAVPADKKCYAATIRPVAYDPEKNNNRGRRGFYARCVEAGLVPVGVPVESIPQEQAPPAWLVNKRMKARHNAATRLSLNSTHKPVVRASKGKLEHRRGTNEKMFKQGRLDIRRQYRLLEATGRTLADVGAHGSKGVDYSRPLPKSLVRQMRFEMEMKDVEMPSTTPGGVRNTKAQRYPTNKAKKAERALGSATIVARLRNGLRAWRSSGRRPDRLPIPILALCKMRIERGQLVTTPPEAVAALSKVDKQRIISVLVMPTHTESREKPQKVVAVATTPSRRQKRHKKQRAAVAKITSNNPNHQNGVNQARIAQLRANSDVKQPGPRTNERGKKGRPRGKLRPPPRGPPKMPNNKGNMAEQREAARHSRFLGNADQYQLDMDAVQRKYEEDVANVLRAHGVTVQPGQLQANGLATVKAPDSVEHIRPKPLPKLSAAVENHPVPQEEKDDSDDMFRDMFADAEEAPSVRVAAEPQPPLVITTEGSKYEPPAPDDVKPIDMGPEPIKRCKSVGGQSTVCISATSKAASAPVASARPPCAGAIAGGSGGPPHLSWGSVGDGADPEDDVLSGVGLPPALLHDAAAASLRCDWTEVNPFFRWTARAVNLTSPVVLTATETPFRCSMPTGEGQMDLRLATDQPTKLLEADMDARSIHGLCVDPTMLTFFRLVWFALILLGRRVFRVADRHRGFLRNCFHTVFLCLVDPEEIEIEAYGEWVTDYHLYYSPSYVSEALLRHNGVVGKVATDNARMRMLRAAAYPVHSRLRVDMLETSLSVVGLLIERGFPRRPLLSVAPPKPMLSDCPWTWLIAAYLSLLLTLLPNLMSVLIRTHRLSMNEYFNNCLLAPFRDLRHIAMLLTTEMFSVVACGGDSCVLRRTWTVASWIAFVPLQVGGAVLILPLHALRLVVIALLPPSASMGGQDPATHPAPQFIHHVAHRVLTISRNQTLALVVTWMVLSPLVAAVPIVVASVVVGVLEAYMLSLLALVATLLTTMVVVIMAAPLT